MLTKASNKQRSHLGRLEGKVNSHLDSSTDGGNTDNNSRKPNIDYDIPEVSMLKVTAMGIVASSAAAHPAAVIATTPTPLATNTESTERSLSTNIYN